jgi:hypothetical protein
LLEAFRGNALLALDQEQLTTASLQNYLLAEVPRTLRKTLSSPQAQTPCLYGAPSEPVVLADMHEILTTKRDKAPESHDLVAELSFVAQQSTGLKSLSGWKRSYSIPDQCNDSSDRFTAKLAAEELSQELDTMYEALKSAFKFSRRDLDAADPIEGAGTIITPHFHYSVSARLNPADLSEVLWTRTVDTIKTPAEVASVAFAKVFDGMFDTLEFSLPVALDMEDFIDAFESAELTDVKISYDREATYCELHFPGAYATVMLEPGCLTIVHERPQNMQQLIESFNSVQQLLGQYHVPLISFTPPAK